MPKRVTEVRTSSINVANRHRKDLGDLSDLMASISEVGLLQPIICRVVDERMHLVAGERRLEATKQLGHKLIPTLIVDSLDTATKALIAERDENQCRKAMTPLELKSLTDELLEIEREAAKERQREHGGTAPGRSADTSDPQIGSVPPHKNEAKAKAADAAGWSRASYERTKRAVETAEDESLPESVRQVARDCIQKLEADEMTPTGADRAIKDAKVEAGIGSTNEKVDKARRENGKGPQATKTEQRLAEFREMSEAGYTSRQIRDRWGISQEGLWSFRKRHGLEPPPADEQLGKTRLHDSNRIVSETVSSLEGICIGLQLVDADDLDREQYDYWVSSLTESIKSITTLKNQLKKELTHVN